MENDALAPAVDRLADAIAEPLLDPVNADRERHAVNAEMTMARSRDGHRMAQVGAETLNPRIRPRAFPAAIWRRCATSRAASCTMRYALLSAALLRQSDEGGDLQQQAAA